MKKTVRFTYTFEAAHRFTKTESIRCMTPHGHSWEATLVYDFKDDLLNQNEMFEEFAKLKSSWKKFIQDVADHSFFHHYEDPLIESLQSNVPEFRSLPFPGDPTTEMVAACFLRKASSWKSDHNFLPSGIMIKETKTNCVELSFESQKELGDQFPILNQFDGWWKDSEISARWVGEQRNS